MNWKLKANKVWPFHSLQIRLLFHPRFIFMGTDGPTYCFSCRSPDFRSKQWLRSGCRRWRRRWARPMSWWGSQAEKGSTLVSKTSDIVLSSFMIQTLMSCSDFYGTTTVTFLFIFVLFKQHFRDKNCLFHWPFFCSVWCPFHFSCVC